MKNAATHRPYFLAKSPKKDSCATALPCFRPSFPHPFSRVQAPAGNRKKTKCNKMAHPEVFEMFQLFSFIEEPFLPLVFDERVAQGSLLKNLNAE
ncbi:MAG: hypothetical protein K9K75_06380 [Deltaproteobacteria bacterium]|nr:hypothetical protein [Deltaproteobacteria bacterium]